MAIVDVNESFKGCVKAEQNDKNVLVLTKLDTPVKRADGKRARYELAYYWLSNSNDLFSVQGCEFSYWLVKEVDLKKGLFEQFQLF